MTQLSRPEILNHHLLWPDAIADILHYSLALLHHLDVPGRSVNTGSMAQILSQSLKYAQVLIKSKKTKP